MPNIKRFGNQEINLLLKEIQTALDLIAEKYDLTSLSLGTTRFNDFSFNSKIEGELDSKFENEYKKYEAEIFAQTHGLPVDLLNRSFVSEGWNYTIVRVEIRNHRYPIIAHCKEDDKSYKFTIEHIKRVLDLL